MKRLASVLIVERQARTVDAELEKSQAFKEEHLIQKRLAFTHFLHTPNCTFRVKNAHP